MAAQRGAATIHYGESFVEVKLENHGTFRTTGAGFKEAKRRYIARALVTQAALIYEGHRDGYETKTYWRQYPIDILAVLVADCQALHEQAGSAPVPTSPSVLKEDTVSDSTTNGNGIVVKISVNDRGNPPLKLADAELQFTTGPLEGLKLIGFSVWQRRGEAGRFNVTFPARQYSVNGERRSFALLRPIVDATAQDRIRDLIIAAYQAHAEQLETAGR